MAQPLRLFPRPERHEALMNTPWEEAIVRSAIEQIVTDAYDHFDPTALWPPHPLDELSAPSTTLYYGAAGVIWALAYLARVGATQTTRDFVSTVEHLIERNWEEMRTMPYPEASSYLMGDIAILLLHWRLASAKEVADLLFHRIEANTAQPVLEFMWGIPGTMLAALFMYEWTGEARWATLFLRQAERLWSEWVETPEWGFLWTQQLYGTSQQWLGTVHGFVGNIQPLLRGAALLDQAKRERLYARVADTIAKTSSADETYANWPPFVIPSPSAQVPVLVQYCHGAPGMVIALAALPSHQEPAVDRLLEKGGELTWKMGPLTKGANLCHGTAGNGYAFLKLYRRSGERVWLDRARAFAMHAIAQWLQSRQKYGQGRYALWTGDLGLAVYLWDCLQEGGQFPAVDIF